jgi:hypothetical protein
VCLVIGFTFFGPKGGKYSADETAAFVAQGSTALIVSVYLVAVSVIGLIVLMAHLSDTCFGAGRQGRVAWGASLLAAASVLIGWGLYLALPTSVISGGPAIDPAIGYTFINAGFVVLFGVGGVLLGIALLTLAIGGRAAQTWVRAFSLLAGLSALFSWAFLIVSKWSPNQWLPVPFYLVVLWGFVLGVWLVVSSPTPDAPMGAVGPT